MYERKKFIFMFIVWYCANTVNGSPISMENELNCDGGNNCVVGTGDEGIVNSRQDVQNFHSKLHDKSDPTFSEAVASKRIKRQTEPIPSDIEGKAIIPMDATSEDVKESSELPVQIKEENDLTNSAEYRKAQANLLSASEIVKDSQSIVNSERSTDEKDSIVTENLSDGQNGVTSEVKTKDLENAPIQPDTSNPIVSLKQSELANDEVEKEDALLAAIKTGAPRSVSIAVEKSNDVENESSITSLDGLKALTVESASPQVDDTAVAGIETNDDISPKSNGEALAEPDKIVNTDVTPGKASTEAEGSSPKVDDTAAAKTATNNDISPKSISETLVEPDANVEGETSSRKDEVKLTGVEVDSLAAELDSLKSAPTSTESTEGNLKSDDKAKEKISTDDALSIGSGGTPIESNVEVDNSARKEDKSKAVEMNVAKADDTKIDVEARKTEGNKLNEIDENKSTSSIGANLDKKSSNKFNINAPTADKATITDSSMQHATRQSESLDTPQITVTAFDFIPSNDVVTQDASKDPSNILTVEPGAVIEPDQPSEEIVINVEDDTTPDGSYFGNDFDGQQHGSHVYDLDDFEEQEIDKKSYDDLIGNPCRGECGQTKYSTSHDDDDDDGEENDDDINEYNPNRFNDFMGEPCGDDCDSTEDSTHYNNFMEPSDNVDYHPHAYDPPRDFFDDFVAEKDIDDLFDLDNEFRREHDDRLNRPICDHFGHDDDDFDDDRDFY